MTCVVVNEIRVSQETQMITVRAKPRGKHDTKPPLASIEETVQLWLSCLNWFGGGRHDFRVDVECCRIPVGREFVGVKVVGQPTHNLASVELRVRPKGSEHQWWCYLICQNEAAASSIIDRVRPEARAYVRRRLEANAPVGQKQIISGSEIPRRRCLKDAPKRCPVAQGVRQFRNREVRRRLCYDLRGSITQGWTEMALLRQAFARVAGQTISDPVLDRVMIDLVEDGILDPHSEPEKFVPTFYFEELCAVRAREIEEENSRRLRERLASKQKLLDAAKRDCERALRQAMEFEARAKALAAEVAAIEAELNPVTPPSPSSVI